MRLLERTGTWAWAVFLRWALDPVVPANLSTRERWAVVLWSVRPGIRHHYGRPLTAWAQKRLPIWMLLRRLEPCGAGWYRIPTMAAALHLQRRLGTPVLEGDFVRVQGGVVTATGVIDEDLNRCELWIVC